MGLVIYRISRWTTENSSYKLHIPAQNGKPLCRQGENDHALSSYESVEGSPTCQKCLKVLRADTTGDTHKEVE